MVELNKLYHQQFLPATDENAVIPQDKEEGDVVIYDLDELGAQMRIDAGVLKLYRSTSV